MNTVYRNICPPPLLFSLLLRSLSAGEFKIGRIPVFQISLNKTVSGQIEDGAKLFACVERRKLRRAKINLYTVCTFSLFILPAGHL